MSRPGRKRTPLPDPRSCEQCGSVFTPRRDSAVYCSEKCRKAAWRESSQEGRIASVRRLRSGQMSVVVHMPKDLALAPGDAIRLGDPPGQERLL
jgi:hypothetical protein